MSLSLKGHFFFFTLGVTGSINIPTFLSCASHGGRGAGGVEKKRLEVKLRYKSNPFCTWSVYLLILELSLTPCSQLRFGLGYDLEGVKR